MHLLKSISNATIIAMMAAGGKPAATVPTLLQSNS